MHGTPANIDDGLGAAFLEDWHRWMHDTTCEAVEWARGEMDIQGADLATLAYLDLDGEPAPAGSIDAAAPWNGFPLRIRTRHGGVAGPAAWEDAGALGVDERDEPVFDKDDGQLRAKRRSAQDEYLEWFGDTITDDDREGIARVHVTCEGPEYWERLAAFGDAGRTRVHELYESLLGRSVPIDELFYPKGAYVRRGGRKVEVGGQYDRFNAWNTDRGAVHLTQVNNTLGAEVNLAARAAIPRRGYAKPANDTSGLTRCGGWGAPDRDSDPHIGAAANSYVRNGFRITLTNPVGLYISELTAKALHLPDGSRARPGRVKLPDGASADLADWWRVVRPTDPGAPPGRRILRAVFEPPDGALYVRGRRRRPLRVSDLYLRDDRITHAGALATEVQMHLFVTAWKVPDQPAPAELDCYDDAWSADIARWVETHCRPTGVAEPMEAARAIRFSTSRT